MLTCRPHAAHGMGLQSGSKGAIPVIFGAPGLRSRLTFNHGIIL
jgi:hypothetical protein